MKKEMKQIEKRCNIGIGETRKIFESLSDEQCIEFKAFLKGESVFADKWLSIMLPYLSIAIAVIAMLHDEDVVLGLLILGIACFCIIRYMIDQIRWSRKIKILSYIDDLEKEKNTGIETEDCCRQADIEEYNYVRQRQQDECKRIYEEWRHMRIYASEQEKLFYQTIHKDLK